MRLQHTINALGIHPAEISSVDGEYVVEVPIGTRLLNVAWHRDEIVIWVAAPLALPGEDLGTVKMRFWVLPSQRRVPLADHAIYIGFADVHGDHVWHVFADYNPVPDETPAHSSLRPLH